jgi:signal transduction histidine kinase
MDEIAADLKPVPIRWAEVYNVSLNYVSFRIKRHMRSQERDLLTILNSVRPYPAVLDYIVDRAGGLIGADAAAVYQLQDDGHQLSIRAARGLPADLAADVVIPVGQGPLGRAVTMGWPVYAPDTAARFRETARGLNPQSHAHLARVRDHYRTVLAVPLWVGERVYGALVLYFEASRSVAQSEIDRMTGFAEQAGLAIANAQQRGRAEQSAAQAERNRLARDLHDAVKPSLFSASVIAEVLPDLWEMDPAEGRRRLEELRELTRTALAECRTLLTVWRPIAVNDGDLGGLLEKLAGAAGGRSHIPIALEVDGAPTLPPDVQLAFYRIAQEALNNVALHSRASRGCVAVRGRDGRLELTVTDNGRGFDLAAVGSGHLGLGIMRERAESVGAELQVVSRPGEGTAVTATWPEQQRGHV